MSFLLHNNSTTHNHHINLIIIMSAVVDFIVAFSRISIREPTAVVYRTTCGLLQNTAVTFRCYLTGVTHRINPCGQVLRRISLSALFFHVAYSRWNVTSLTQATYAAYATS